MLALSDTDRDNHTGKRQAGIYIYTCIMHNASTQSKKVNAYIPKVWPKMRTKGTKHDIPNINHLREKGRRNDGV